MKVIFLEDVPNVGRAGETGEVADGYGRNYLLPQNLAVLADSRSSNVVEAQLKKIARRQALVEAEMKELAGQLEGKEFVFKARAGAKDRLYGSITHADIAEELSKSSGYEVDKKKIELEEPIHQLGSYEVTIRLAKDIVPTVKITVVAEEEKKEEKKEESKEGKKKGKAKKQEESEEVKQEETAEKQEESEEEQK